MCGEHFCNTHILEHIHTVILLDTDFIQTILFKPLIMVSNKNCLLQCSVKASKIDLIHTKHTEELQCLQSTELFL